MKGRRGRERRGRPGSDDLTGEEERHPKKKEINKTFLWMIKMDAGY